MICFLADGYSSIDHAPQGRHVLDPYLPVSSHRSRESTHTHICIPCIRTHEAKELDKGLISGPAGISELCEFLCAPKDSNRARSRITKILGLLLALHMHELLVRLSPSQYYFLINPLI
jgi:hypothetical protein